MSVEVLHLQIDCTTIRILKCFFTLITLEAAMKSWFMAGSDLRDYELVQFQCGLFHLFHLFPLYRCFISCIKRGNVRRAPLLNMLALLFWNTLMVLFFL